MLILLSSAVFDVRFHKIPNWLVCIGAVIGVMLTSKAGLTGISWFLVKITVVIILGFPLFRCRMIGAGDLKLMALICGYLGLYHGFIIIFYGLAAGAAVSLYKLCSYGCLVPRLSYLFSYLKQLFQTKKISYYYNVTDEGYRMTIPLAVYFFFGGLFDLFCNQIGGIL